MSALPDLRLQATPEVKSKAKQPAKAPEPSKNGASSFAEVYAKERQAKPGEHAGNVEKPKPEQGNDPATAEADAATAAAEQPEVAASGNSLPSEDIGEEELDPLLAMALGGVQPQTEEAALPDEELDPVALVITGTANASPAAGEETGPVTEEEGLDPLAMLDSPPEELAVKPTPVQEAVSKSTKTVASADFAAAMAAMGKGEESTTTTDESTLDLPLESLAKDVQDSLKDSVQPNRPDQFVSKLSALTQALNQQTNAAQRLPLVPGQPVAMQQAGWSEAVVDRVMWLSSQNLKSAEIQLDPADLGRLEVRVHMTQDQAQVTFASPNAGVRDALEGQMHRLREMFAQQGMNLADANVSDQSLNRGWQGQGQGEGGRGGSGARDGLFGGDEGQAVGHQEIRSDRLSSGRGLVDYYA